MFTGIVSHVGRIRRREDRGDLRVEIEAGGMDLATAALGASIACGGVCLTLVDKGEDWFAVDVSAETLRRTAPRQWQQGARINLERALRLGDELGGHLVTGHVDGLGHVAMRQDEGDSIALGIRVPQAQGCFIAEKGSVTVDGVSLTVNAVGDSATETHFTLNIIPHTADHTTLSELAVGDAVNIEIDVLARYLKRLKEAPAPL